MNQLPDDVVILISDFIGPQSGLCLSHVSAGTWRLLERRHLYGLSERIPPLAYSKVPPLCSFASSEFQFLMFRVQFHMSMLYVCSVSSVGHNGMHCIRHEERAPKAGLWFAFAFIGATGILSHDSLSNNPHEFLGSYDITAQSGTINGGCQFMPKERKQPLLCFEKSAHSPSGLASPVHA
jgi:hypothetical protein